MRDGSRASGWPSHSNPGYTCLASGDRHAHRLRCTPALIVVLLAACGGSRSFRVEGARDDAGDVRSRPMRTTCSRRCSTNEVSAQVGAVLFEKLAEMGDSLQRHGRPRLSSFARRLVDVGARFTLDCIPSRSEGALAGRCARASGGRRVQLSRQHVARSSARRVRTAARRHRLRDGARQRHRGRSGFTRARSSSSAMPATQMRVLPAHLLAERSRFRARDCGVRPESGGQRPIQVRAMGERKHDRGCCGQHLPSRAARRSIASSGASRATPMPRCFACSPARRTSRSRCESRTSSRSRKHPELKVVRYPSMTRVLRASSSERSRGWHGPHPDIRRSRCAPGADDGGRSQARA